MWLAMGGGGCDNWYELFAVLVVCQREGHAVRRGKGGLCVVSAYAEMDAQHLSGTNCVPYVGRCASWNYPWQNYSTHVQVCVHRHVYR